MIAYSFGFSFISDKWQLVILFVNILDIPKLILVFWYYKIDSPYFVYEKY